MRISYFKPRKPFDFSPHSYDIGNPIGSWHKYEDNHFLNKIYKFEEVEFEKYYKYHLAHALDNKFCTAEYFFFKVWGIVDDRIENLKSKDPFSTYHDRYVFRIEKLQQFQKYLNSIDQWNARPSHIVIAEKEELIQKQKEEIEKLTARLSELNDYEVLQKISIGDNALPTLVDLLKKMSNLTLPSGRGDTPIKGTLIREEHQLFEIVPVKEVKK